MSAQVTDARPCLLLTRPEAASCAFAEEIRAAGWRGKILVAPLMEIRLIAPDPRKLARARSLIFTSQNAVASIARTTARRDWPVWAVGRATAEAARAAGFTDVSVAQGTAVSLLAALAAAPPPAPILHCRGAHIVADMVAELAQRGQIADGEIVYTQDPLPLSREAKAALREAAPLVLPVFSPRSGRLVRKALARLGHDGAGVYLVAISQAAREAVDLPALAASRVAQTPDSGAMAAEILQVQAMLEPSEKPS